MKLIWNPAITVDGNIAKADGDSDWPSDSSGASFSSLIRQHGAVIVGHRSYKQYQGAVFPVAGATSFVWTHDPESGQHCEGVEFLGGKPGEVLAEIESRGFSTCVLAGGTTTCNAFFSARLVDEIVADVHPLLLGGGMSAITLPQFEAELELLDHRDLVEGVVQIRYRVVKA